MGIWLACPQGNQGVGIQQLQMFWLQFYFTLKHFYNFFKQLLDTGLSFFSLRVCLDLRYIVLCLFFQFDISHDYNYCIYSLWLGSKNRPLNG